MINDIRWPDTIYKEIFQMANAWTIKLEPGGIGHGNIEKKGHKMH